MKFGNSPWLWYEEKYNELWPKQHTWCKQREETFSCRFQNLLDVCVIFSLTILEENESYTVLILLYCTCFFDPQSSRIILLFTKDSKWSVLFIVVWRHRTRRMVAQLWILHYLRFINRMYPNWIILYQLWKLKNLLHTRTYHHNCVSKLCERTYLSELGVFNFKSLFQVTFNT